MWEKFWRELREQKGQVTVPIAVFIGLVLITLVMVVFVPLLSLLSDSAAVNQLEGKGYVVLGADDYDDLITRLQALKVAADAAEANAVIAAAAAQDTLDKLELFNENEANLFPDSTVKNVTLTAGVKNTFSAWTEVTDNTGTTFSSIFAADDGYIREVMMYAYSTPDKLCILEIGYGPDIAHVTTIGRCLVRSDFTWVLNFYSPPITAGSKVYYRFMSEQAAETFKASFKYYLST